ncbi:MAG: SurA N-terminal domain-containing protein [Deltaproteobacteria bacterium]|jgi:peptidyl-prolyl cis-trans isomerase D|nr:SurA N-terminal domain-containing protein [Deltaproteobacteria bacterium]
MLDYIRKRSGGFISFFIIGAIALVFVFWGIGGQNTGDMSNIVMDGDKVSVYSYMELKRESLDQLKTEAEGMDPDVLNQTAARRALSFLTQRHVLRNLAKNTGRKVPESELVRQITSQPAFQDEAGVFRKSLYERYITQVTGSSIASFEGKMADDILVQDVAGLVEGLGFTTTNSLMEKFHFSEDEVKLNYAYFAASAFASGIEPSPQELESYYESNKESFRTPVEVKADYVAIAPNSFMDKVEVTEDEARNLYEDELADYTIPASAEVSHILFKFPNFFPTPEEKAAVLQKAQDALKRLETEDFATVAKEVSEDDSTKAQGGSLGTLNKGATVKEFEDAAFGEGAQNPGKVIGPVETNFGYHLIKVDSVTPASTRPFEEVKADIEKRIQTRKARRMAINQAEDLSEKAQREVNADLKTLAQSEDIPCETSDFFSAENPPEWLRDPLEIQKALNSPLKVISQVIDVPETPDSPELMVIYMPVERRDSVIPPLTDETVSEKAKEGFIQEAALNIALKTAEAYTDAAKRLGFSLGLDTFPKDKIDQGVTDFFPRLRFLYMTQPPVNAADPNQLFDALFQLSSTGDVADKPIAVELPDGKGYLVVGLADFKAADESTISSNLEPMRQQAMDSASQSSYAIWSSEEIGKMDLRLPREVQDDLENTVQLN